MPFAVLNEALELARTPTVDYGYRDELPTAEWMRKGPYLRQAVALYDASRRVYNLTLPVPRDERAALLAFLEARAWTVGAFLFRDPRDERRADSIGTGDNATLVFSLETSPAGDAYRFFPRAATAEVLVNGSHATATALGWTVDTDARTVTFSAPPLGGHDVTIRYDPLRLVHLREAPSFDSKDPAFEEASLELVEILRDS